ncbi:Methyltransferase domain-containing protein [Pricia antarctica]|uniref:Methyltransferase domain-containing protein n=1 Tax=Pricia antarctica TaxID=641691 RepID=A0A1G7GX39_9FLAO|nr:class I SAM-dependent methyltransferase [Pricia antarctica]SDE92730.1 Methyltransferase domain-containing protein [Pricia antarctica]
MIEKKIRKHLSITRTRLNQKKEFERIAKYNNKTLNTIVESLSKVKNSDFTDEDRQSFQNCEKYRTNLLEDETLISYEIFGSDKTALVKDICKNAASSKKWCEFLYFLSKKNNPSTILEIGTNLGISGCYALESIKNDSIAKFITMEGLPQLCKIAGHQFSSIAPTSKYDIRKGLFEATFPQLLKEDIFFDLLFIDGNHQKEPTITYFKALKDKIKSPAIFVFDDINWSHEMKEAWDFIKNDSDVSFTIDLYKQGIVIIDENESEKNVQFELHLGY